MRGQRFWAGMLVLAAIGRPSSARACGGFFCDGGAAPPVQSSERVIFTHRDGVVTAYVQIQYQGDPDNFAWVIPVPALPRLGTASPAIFDAMDQLTAPTFEFHYRDRVETIKDDASGGCGNGGPRATTSYRDRTDSGSNVRVIGMSSVGPFETTTITSDNPNTIANWLVDHGYRLPRDADVILADYVRRRSYFVALRLRSDATSGTLAPIVLSYVGDEPCIPLKITALASTDVLDVTTFLVSRGRAVSTTYGEALPRYNLVRPVPGGVGGAPTTYWLVAQDAVREAGGRAFVTELATPVSRLAGDPLAEPVRELLAEGPYLTRLFTRIRREDMLADPGFSYRDDLVDVGNRHPVDLSDQPAFGRVFRVRVPGTALALAPFPLVGLALWRRRCARRPAGPRSPRAF